MKHLNIMMVVLLALSAAGLIGVLFNANQNISRYWTNTILAATSNLRNCSQSNDPRPCADLPEWIEKRNREDTNAWIIAWLVGSAPMLLVLGGFFFLRRRKFS